MINVSDEDLSRHQEKQQDMPTDFQAFAPLL